MPRPLEGIRVLENTIAVAGPSCGMVLAHLGAEVIRVESSKSQTWGTREGKKSLALNLKTEKGKEIFKELAKKSDILLENYAPGAMERLGLGYDDIKEVNSKIIYASLTGYGHTGPHNRRPGFDFTVQGRCGLAWLNSKYTLNGEPSVCQNTALSDRLSGLNTSTAILAALHYREKTGKGQHVDIAMLDSMVRNLLDGRINQVLLEGEYKDPYKGRLYSPGYQPAKCKDGFVMLGFIGTRIWSRFLRLAGRPELVEYFEKEGLAAIRNRPDLADTIQETIDEWLSTRTREEASKELQEAGCPADPVLSLEEVTNDPQLRARGMFIKAYNPDAKKEVEIIGSSFKLSETPGGIDPKLAYPELGEHTEEILSSVLGYNKDEIAKLKEDEITV
jgi:formyl-CoA transferase